MADSPAKRHHSRVLAELEAAQRAPHQLMAGATAYEQHMAQLQSDRLRLKQIQSTQGKAALKVQLLPTYVPYLAGVLAGGQGAQDEIVMTCMVWRIDAGDYAGALELGAYVLKHGLQMPDRFSRTVGCVLAEEIAEAALSAQKTGQQFDAAVLADTATLTAEQDMPDEVRAKLHLALARASLAGITDETPADQAQPIAAAAVADLQRAIALHGSCGGKKDLERAERLLKKFSVEPAGTNA
ncbi:terminase [Xanthomonas citri pv. citri]|uniref:phage terminase small subunit n=2 Tax=Xanthomonas citri TaxID=346 RepID=UPI000EF2D413|nr:phage terminase small subunit [Xanthomonas citri]AYL25768.1 terminase [Xanthomonas citri pv. citri]